MQSVMYGCGVAGILVAILRIITKSSYPNSAAGLKKGARLYFLLSAMFLILCFGFYFWYRKNENENVKWKCEMKMWNENENVKWINNWKHWFFKVV